MSEPFIHTAENILTFFPTLSSEERVSAALNILDISVEQDPMLGALGKVLSKDEKEALYERATTSPYAHSTPGLAGLSERFDLYTSLGIIGSPFLEIGNTQNAEDPTTYDFSSVNTEKTLHLHGSVVKGVAEKTNCLPSE